MERETQGPFSQSLESDSLSLKPTDKLYGLEHVT